MSFSEFRSLLLCQHIYRRGAGLLDIVEASAYSNASITKVRFLPLGHL